MISITPRAARRRAVARGKVTTVPLYGETETTAVPHGIEQMLTLREQSRTPVLVGAYASCVLLVLLGGLTDLTVPLSLLAVLPLLCIVVVSRAWWTSYVVAATLTVGIALACRALPNNVLPTPAAVAWYGVISLATYSVLVALVQALLYTAVTLRCCLHALAEERSTAWCLATTDPLTGLANRRRFDAHLATEISRCAQHGDPLAVLLLDIKEINDSDGHAAGDAALIRVGAALSAEIGVNALAARIDGDEFAVVLPATTQEQADQIARAVVTHLHDEEEDPLSASLGVACLGSLVPRHPGEVASVAALLLAQADRALYQAKRRGQRGRGKVALAVVSA